MHKQPHILLTRLLLAVLSATTFSVTTSAQSLRICSYNVLDGPVSNNDDQNFRAVIQAIANLDVLGNARPIDILAFQEGPEDADEYEDIEVNFETVFGGNFESCLLYTSPSPRDS